MATLSNFCTCTNTDCPLHPIKHNKGCAPCIAKNLKLNEIPNCFFNKLKNKEKREGDSFADFADAVRKSMENK